MVLSSRVSGTNDLSGHVSVYGTSFIMSDFGRHDEADSLVTGDKANAYRRSFSRLDSAAIDPGRGGTVTGRVCPDLPALYRP